MLHLTIAKNVCVTKNCKKKKLQITYSRTTSIKHLFITDNFRTKFSQFFLWKDKKDSIYKRTKDQEGGDYQKSQDSNRLERSSWKWNLLFGRVFTKHPGQWRRLESLPILSQPVSGFCWTSVALRASFAPSALIQSTCGKSSLYPREKGEIIHIN